MSSYRFFFFFFQKKKGEFVLCEDMMFEEKRVFWKSVFFKKVRLGFLFLIGVFLTTFD
ncbi:hypothetical protein ID0278_08440 [Helicobacter pylori]